MTFDQFVKLFTDEEKIQFIRDHQKFGEHGHIGECSLRIAAKKFNVECIKMHEGFVITDQMAQITNSCYKYFAQKYLAERDEVEAAAYKIFKNRL